MTAAVPDPRFRDQLEATAHQSIQQASWARGVAMLDSDVAAFRQRLLEDLMPVVDRIATARAAAELQAAADEAHAGAYTEQRLPWVVIRARADALDPKPTERTCSAGVPRSSCCGLPGACGDC